MSTVIRSIAVTFGLLMLFMVLGSFSRDLIQDQCLGIMSLRRADFTTPHGENKVLGLDHVDLSLEETLVENGPQLLYFAEAPHYTYLIVPDLHDEVAWYLLETRC